MVIYKVRAALSRDMATTTIQLSRETRDALAAMKLHPRESFDEVLGRVLEDLQELDESTKRAIARARKEIAAGHVLSHEQVRTQMGF